MLFWRNFWLCGIETEVDIDVCLKWLQDSLALKDGVPSNQIRHSLCMLTEFTLIMAGWYFLACHSENVKANP